MSDLVTNATDDSYDTLIADPDKLVLVDFWADWCGPCKAFAPTLDDIAEEYADELSVVKVDIVANEATANRLGVQGIPLLLFYKGGKEVDRAVGSMTRSRLASQIERLL